MTSVCTYLNFMGNTEEAFEFYKSVFGTEYAGNGLMRMGEIPPQPDMPEMTDADKQKVLHVSLPTFGDHMLMGTDLLESMGQTLVEGNNVSVMIVPDTRAAADELHAKLSDGATDVEPMADMFWGDYYGSCCDRFGVRWMIDVDGEAG